MSRRTEKSEERNEEFASPLRVWMLVLPVVIGFILIIFRLFGEQVRNGDERRRKATAQSVRRIRLPGRRGCIFSADGRVLAGNAGTRRLLFFPEEMRKRRRKDTVAYMQEVALRLSQFTGRECTLNARKLNYHLANSPTMPVTVMDNLTPLEAARAVEMVQTLPGVELTGSCSRSYPEGFTASQLIGYTGDSSPGMEEKGKFNYFVPDTVGRAGAEKAFDTLTSSIRGLRGEPGFTIVQVDHVGYARRRHLGRSEPFDGNHVMLTLNLRAQKLAEELLGEHRGAIVVLDAGTGGILAAASSPRYDLARFTPSIPGAYYRMLREDSSHPLLNRATAGTYTPGSIAKVPVSLALLNAGWDPERKIHCPGYAVIGNAKIRCASIWGHGDLNLSEAIMHSCNTYMIEAAKTIGPAAIAQVMSSANLGRKTGVEIEESAGLVPSPELKFRRYHTRWNAFDTALISIGQGMVTVTPLQAANIAAAMANKGVYFKPHLIDRVVDTSGRTVWHKTPEFGGRLIASSQAIEIVRNAMYMVVNSPEGSGKLARRKWLRIYGKTGSAEVGPKHNRTKNVWFIAFTEHKGKKYAFSAVIEHGSSGGRDCAPLAGAFFERFLLHQQ